MSGEPAREVLVETKYLRLVRAGHWVYAQRPNVTGIVCIAAVTEEDKLLLVEQFRIPVNAPVIELPAGLAGDEVDLPHESLAAAAKRELLEETGYTAAEIQEIVTTTSSAGMTDECVTLFMARDLKRIGAGGGVAGEEITLHQVPLATVPDWLRKQISRGALVDARVHAALYFLQRA